MEQTANHDRCSWWSTLYSGKSGLCEIQHLMNGPWSHLAAVSDGGSVSSSLLIERILFPKLSSFLWEVCKILAYAQTICISLTFKFTFLIFFFFCIASHKKLINTSSRSADLLILFLSMLSRYTHRSVCTYCGWLALFTGLCGCVQRVLD